MQKRIIDKAVLFWGAHWVTDMLKGEGSAGLLEVWRRRGRKAFEAEKAQAASLDGP